LDAAIQKNRCKDPSIKGFPVRGGCGHGEFFRYGRPHFLLWKNFGFFKIYRVSARTGGFGL